MPKKFSPELRDRAVRMVDDRQALEGGPRSESIRARRAPTRRWHGDAEDLVQPIRASRALGQPRGVSRGGDPDRAQSSPSPWRANEILKAASVFFARELDHPTTK